MGRSAFVASLALAISFGTACSSTTVGGPEGTNGPTTSNPTTPSQDGGDGAEGGTNGSKDASTDDTNECPKTVTASSVTRPKPFRGQKKGACSAQDLSAFDTTGSYDDIAKKMTPECRACAISTKSDATWGATFATRDNVYFNFGGCLEARGESPTCARGIMTLVLCVSDACSSCSSGQESACRKSMSEPSGACYGIVESDLNDCSPNANDNLDVCAGKTVLSTICGGDTVSTCSTLAQQGPSVTGVAGTTVPNFTGGTIANGVWVVTKIEGFGAFGGLFIGKTGKTTLQVSGTNYEQVTVDDSTGKQESSRGTLQTTGTSVTFSQTCPSAQQTNQSYTATATTLTVGLGFSSGANGVVITYAKK